MENIIRKLRKQHGLTMKELAQKVGVSEGTISRWESGEIANMKRNYIAALSEVFNIPPTDFLDITDNHNTEQYYIDPEVAEYANKLKDNPDMRLLFDAAEDMSKDDIDFVVNLIEGLKKREGK